MKVVFKILEYLPETDQIVVNFCRQNAPKPVDEHKPLVIDCKHIDMTDKVNLIESLTQLLTPHIYRRESEEPTLPENVGGEMFFPETIEDYIGRVVCIDLNDLVRIKSKRMKKVAIE